MELSSAEKNITNRLQTRFAFLRYAEHGSPPVSTTTVVISNLWHHTSLFPSTSRSLSMKALEAINNFVNMQNKDWRRAHLEVCTKQLDLDPCGTNPSRKMNIFGYSQEAIHIIHLCGSMSGKGAELAICFTKHTSSHKGSSCPGHQGMWTGPFWPLHSDHPSLNLLLLISLSWWIISTPFISAISDQQNNRFFLLIFHDN